MGIREPFEIAFSIGLVWAIVAMMVFPAIVLSVYFGVSTAFGLWVRRRRNAAIAKAADDLDLPRLDRAFGALVADGWIGEYRVIIEGRGGAIRVGISGSPLPRHFEIHGAEPTTVTTGDEAFDWNRYLRGSEPDVLSRLDAPTRAWLVSTRATFVDAELAVVVSLRSPRLTEIIREALVAANRLASTRTAEGLLEIAKSDPVAGVREAAESALTKLVPASAEAASVFREWLEDSATGRQRRARARLFLGMSVVDGDIEEIAMMLTDRGAERVLARLLAAVPESVLTQLLAHVSDAHAERIVDRLARTGTASSVEPLRKHPALPGSRVAAGVARAIAQIQARLEGDGGSAGQLALTEAETAGALALDDERGALSLPYSTTKH